MKPKSLSLALVAASMFYPRHLYRPDFASPIPIKAKPTDSGLTEADRQRIEKARLKRERKAAKKGVQP